MTMHPNPHPQPTIALRCPKCAAEMVTYERSGIVVDQCRECRGIFLDRGELEKLVDAESGGAGWTGPRLPASPVPASPVPAAPLPAGPLGGLDPRTMGVDPRFSYRADWQRDDDDDDDARRYRRDRDWEDRGRPDDRGRPPKRRSLLGELLEGLGD